MKKRFVIYISIIAILVLVSTVSADSPWVAFNADLKGIEEIYFADLIPNEEGDTSWPSWLVTYANTTGSPEPGTDFGATFNFPGRKQIKAAFELDSIVHTPAIIGDFPEKGDVIDIFIDGLWIPITINLNRAIVQATLTIYNEDGELELAGDGKGRFGEFNTTEAYGEWAGQEIRGKYKIVSFEFPPPDTFYVRMHGKWRNPDFDDDD